MSTAQQVSRSFVPAAHGRGFQRVLAEVGAIADAFLNPGQIVRKVEEFARLQAQADRVEATDPARAAALRQRASRVLS